MNKSLKVPTILKHDFEAYHFAGKSVYDIQPHSHDYYEIYFFVSGNVRYHIEGTTYHLQNNSIMIITPNSMHKASVDTSIPYERYVLFLTNEYLQKLSTETSNLSSIFNSIDQNKQYQLHIPQSEIENIKSFFTKIIAHKDSDEFGHDLICKVNIVNILLALNGFKENKTDTFQVNNQLVDTVTKYIEDNLIEDISIETICNKFHVSPSHLSRQFNKHIGISVNKYIIQKRLVLAKSMIAKDYAIMFVVESCGFKDYNGFFKTFKKEFDMTPKQYYKLINGK